jgi:hypothetical protein
MSFRSSEEVEVEAKAGARNSLPIELHRIHRDKKSCIPIPPLALGISSIELQAIALDKSMHVFLFSSGSTRLGPVPEDELVGEI